MSRFYDRRVVERADQHHARQLSPLQIDVWIKVFRLVDEKHEITQYDVTRDHVDVTGEKPLSLQQWCQLHAHHFQPTQ